MNSTDIRTVALFVVMLLSSHVEATADSPLQPGPTVNTVAEFLERYQFTKRPLDDDLSRQWFDAFISSLDPHRMYFLSQDIREFSVFREQLDDQAKNKTFAFPILVRERYRERVKDAASIAEELLSNPFDFSAAEECPRSYADNSLLREELKERWRLRLKLELLVEKLHGRPVSEVRSQILKRYQRISRQAHEMNDERLTVIFLDSLAKHVDAYARYFPPGYPKEHLNYLKKRQYTLGLSLRESRGRLVIDSIVPALQCREACDRLIGWQLMAIQRIDGTILDLVEMNLEDAAELIRSNNSPLNSETEVILELIQPTTLRRLSISWQRLQVR